MLQMLKNGKIEKKLVSHTFLFVGIGLGNVSYKRDKNYVPTHVKK